MNYYGKEMQHKQIPAESLDVFTIGNVKEGSRWYVLYFSIIYQTTLIIIRYEKVDLFHSLIGL